MNTKINLINIAIAFILATQLANAIGDQYVNIRVQDESFTILDEAVVDISEIFTNNTEKVHTIYGNTEKRVLLQTGHLYLIQATLTDYEQENGFFTFKPEEYNGIDLVINMRTVSSSENIKININSDSTIVFNDSLSTKDLTVTIDSLFKMDSSSIVWTINGTSELTYTADPQVTTFSATRTFTRGDDQHEINVYVEGNLKKQYVINEETQTDYAEEVSALASVRTSKIAFFVFLMFAMMCAAGIQYTFKDYGLPGFTAVTAIFAFLNYYMIVVAVPMILALIAKQVIIGGD
jgi:hypothetical protein